MSKREGNDGEAPSKSQSLLPAEAASPFQSDHFGGLKTPNVLFCLK